MIEFALFTVLGAVVFWGSAHSRPRLLTCVFVGLLAACSVTLLPSPRVRGLAQPSGPTATPEECDALDRASTGWTAAAVVGGVLGGGSGISTLFTSGDVSRYVVGGVTIGVAAMTAAAGYLSTSYAQKYVARCTQNAGGLPGGSK